MRSIRLITLLVILAGVLAVVVGYGTGSSDNPRSDTSQSNPVPLSAEMAPATAPEKGGSELIDQLAVRYLERYGDTIDNPATQAELLNERQQLIDEYGAEQGHALFLAALETAFPQRNQAILALIEQLLQYHAWLSENDLTLREMALVERRGAIWQKREALFGSDAELIWADELAEMEERQTAMHDALDRLDQAHEITLEETAYQLQVAIEDVYGNGVERQLISPDALGGALFTMESVQSQLQSLPSEQRQETINELRRTMGYSDQAIERLAERDKERNARWDNGLAYMQEREQLTRRYTGEQQAQKLDELRQEHFGHAAETIRREEESDFYRFERPRRFGLN